MINDLDSRSTYCSRISYGKSKKPRALRWGSLSVEVKASVLTTRSSGRLKRRLLLLRMLNMMPFDAFLFEFRLAGPHARQHSTAIISAMDQRQSSGIMKIQMNAWQMNHMILVIYARGQVSYVVYEVGAYAYNGGERHRVRLNNSGVVSVVSI